MADNVTTAIIAGAFGLVTVTATLAVGIWKGWWEQKEANKRPFLEKQLQLCFEATDLCARLATEKDVTEWEKARAGFWRLYWGPLCIVEDPEVEKAMVAIGELVPRPGANPPSLPMVSLGPMAMAVARASRALVLESWRVDIENLEWRKATSAAAAAPVNLKEAMAAKGY